MGSSPVLQDSRFEVFKNGTLRINSVEVYDGTWYRCVSSTPAGTIEAQARVQVLGELAPGPNGQERTGLPPQALPFPLLKQKSSSSHHHPGHSSAWSLTRRPQCPAQPRAERSPLLSGSGQVGTLWAFGGGVEQAVHWSDMCLSQDQLSAWYCRTDKECRGRFILQLEEGSQT